jgi:hypothetical protein
VRDLERGERGARDQSELHMAIIRGDFRGGNGGDGLNTPYQFADISEVEINLDE